MTTQTPTRLSALLRWSVIGQIVYVITQFGQLAVLARLANIEDVGRFGLVSAVVIPICFFFRLNMRANQTTDTHRLFRFSEFLRVQVISISMAYLIILGIAFAFFDPVTRNIAIIFGAAKCAETYSEFCYGIFQRAERMVLVARSLILRGVGSLVAFAVVLALTEDVATAFLAHLFVWGGIAWAVDFRTARHITVTAGDTESARPEMTVALARQALPLGITGLIAGLQGNVPRYVIASVLGVAALGAFTVVAYAIQAVGTLVTAVGNALMARLSQLAVAGKPRAFTGILRKTLAVLTVGGVAVSVACWFIGDWLVVFIFGPQYPDLGNLLALCMIAATCRAWVLILQTGLLSLRRFKENAWIRIAMISIMVPAVWIGAKLGGLSGVTLAFAGVLALHAVFLWIFMQRYLPMKG